jgi:hypothetical protein
MFGYMRGTGMLFATIVTGMLVKFGGYALTGLSEGIMGRVQSGAGQAAQTTLTPEAPGIAQRREAMSWSFTTAMVNGYEAREWMRMGAQEMALSDAAGKLSTQRIINAKGGFFSAAGAMADARYVSTMEMMGSTQLKQALANNLFGGDVEALARWQAGGMVIENEAMAQKFRQAGWNVEVGQKITGFGVDSQGNVRYLTAELQDGSQAIITRDGVTEIRRPIYDNVVGQKLQERTIKDAQGNITQEATGVLQGDRTFSYDGNLFTAIGGATRIHRDGTGNYTLEGQFIGSDGQVYSGTMKLDARGNVISTSLNRGVQATTEEALRDHIVTHDARQQLAYAQLARQAGAENVAQFIERNLGKTMEFNISRSPDGSVATVNVSYGGESHYFDYDAKKIGNDYRTIRQDIHQGVLHRKDLEKLQADFLKQGKTDLARTVGKMIEFMKSHGLEAANVTLVKDPRTGAFASLVMQSGVKGEAQAFALDQKGWEKDIKALVDKVTGSHTTEYKNRTDVKGGTSYDFGNDLYAMIQDPERHMTDFLKKYGFILRDTQAFNVFINKATEYISTFGKTSQETRDAFSAGWKGSGGANAGLGTGDKGSGPKAGVSVGAEAAFGGQRTAIETASSNTLAVALQERLSQFRDDPRLGDAEKARLILKTMHDTVYMLKTKGLESTVEQIKKGAWNPVKDGGVTIGPESSPPPVLRQG